MSIEERKQKFINKAKKVHGDKYDYSSVEYIKARLKVDITCKIHGVFSQTPDSHTAGHGCGRCNGSYRIDTDEFISNAIKVHGDTYDYSKTIYGKNNIDKVTIICKIHGEFKQVAAYHLDGNGCQICGNEKKISNGSGFKSNYDNNKKTEVFKNKAEQIYGKELFDYSLTEFITSNKKVFITCNKHHNTFLQTPNQHLNGHSGCSKCKESRGERTIRIFLENNNIKFVQEKRFKDCKVKKALSFDFYLSDLNTCIEFDGIQHFKPIDHFGGVENYINTKKFDRVKNKYCRKNNIKIIRIPYYKLHKINDILNFIL